MVLVHAELDAELVKSVLRMSQEDGGHLLAHGDTDVLGHRTQGIADGGGDDAVQVIHGAVQQHLQRQLCDSAVECRAVFLRAGNALGVGAPDSHRDHAGSVHQLFRSVVRKNADDLLALCFIFLQLSLRGSGDFSKFL